MCQKVTSLVFGVGVSKASLPSRKDLTSPVASVRALAEVPQQLQNWDEINSVYFDPTRLSVDSSQQVVDNAFSLGERVNSMKVARIRNKQFT